MVVVLNYVHKFFDAPPSKRWSPNALLSSSEQNTVTHFNTQSTVAMTFSCNDQHQGTVASFCFLSGPLALGGR